MKLKLPPAFVARIAPAVMRVLGATWRFDATLPDGADDVLGYLVALQRPRGHRHVAQLLDHLGVRLDAECEPPVGVLHHRDAHPPQERAAVAFDAKSKDPTKPDKTHLSDEGAAKTADLVAQEIRKNAPELAKLLRP